MAGVFRHQHRVTYAECTVGNHVYYARYLDLLETARSEFFRTLGTPMLEWQTRGVIFPVIEARLRYQAPARYDDVLTLAIAVTKAERARLNFEYRIENQSGIKILAAETFHVCAGLNDKPRRLPEELIASLQPFLKPLERADVREGVFEQS